MKISDIKPLDDFTLRVSTADGQTCSFDVKPYLEYEAFLPLKSFSEFQKVTNHGYFIEWDCGADLSADTVEAKMVLLEPSVKRTVL